MAITVCDEHKQGYYRIIFVLSICPIDARSTLQRNPIPVEEALQVQIPGIPNARAWSGTFSRHFEDDCPFLEMTTSRRFITISQRTTVIDL